MGAKREDLMDTTMVRMPNGSFLPMDYVRSMNAIQLADAYKARSGFNSSLDTTPGIQSAQEMFNQTYAEGVAEDYLASIFETQLTPEQLEAQRLGLSVEQMKGDTEDMVRNILQFGGQDESNQLAINALVAGKAKQAGVPQPSQQDIVDYLADIGAKQEAAADPTLADKAADAVGKAQGAITTAGTAVGSAMDKVFDILRGAGLNIPNPNKAIMYPRQGAGQLIFGPGGNTPVNPIGTTPAGTQVAVGGLDPTVQKVLDKVKGVITGEVSAKDILTSDDVLDILVSETAKETGIPEEQIGQILNQGAKVASKVVPKTTLVDESGGTTLGVDLGSDKTLTGTPVASKDDTTLPKGPEKLSVAGGMGALDTVTKGTRIPPAAIEGKNKGVGADSKNKGVGAGEISDRVIGEGLKGTPPPPDDPPKVVIPDTFVPKGELPKVVVPDTFVPKGDEPAPKGNLPVEQSSGTFIGGIRTSPGELVDIDYLYDIGGESIFAPKLKSKEQEDPLAYLYSGYADGGIVQDSEVQQFIQYLMGTRG